MKNGRIKEEERICWYKNGRLHREDGPAVLDIFAEQIFYYWEGKRVSKLQHEMLVAQRNLSCCSFRYRNNN